jgi:hypothetical protein
MLVSCLASSSVLRMEVICSSEIVPDFHWTTWCYIPEGSTKCVKIFLTEMPAFNIWTKQLTKCWIWGSHSCGYKEFCLLRYNWITLHYIPERRQNSSQFTKSYLLLVQTFGGNLQLCHSPKFKKSFHKWNATLLYYLSLSHTTFSSLLPPCHSVTRKHIKKPKKKRVTNIKNFHEDVICKTILENDNRPIPKK